MNANKKNAELRGSRIVGTVAVVSLTLRRAFSKEDEVRESRISSPSPDFAAGLWENAYMWQRRSIR